MKRKFLMAVMVMILGIMIFGTMGTSAETYGDLTYTVDTVYERISITKCKSSATGDIVIPATIGNYPVTSIGISAFQGCTGITSVTIPEGVTTIWEKAFRKCTGLKSVIIPDSVKSIGDNVFAECTSLTSVTLPEKITKINSSVFYFCTSLPSINIPDSVTTISYNAFYNCNSLKSITIPDSVTTIGGNAFYNCTGLTSINIPAGVTTMGVDAFINCSGLTRVNITDLKAWCEIEFGDEDANPLYKAKNLYLNGNLISELVIPNDIIKVNNYAFRNCTGLTNVTIPDGVTTIGDYAFSGCTGLTEITISDSVTKIGSDAFYGCIGLTSITIPAGVTNIKNYSFGKCIGLTSITIPVSVTSIQNYAFSGCNNIKTVYYEGTEKEWNEISIESGNEGITETNIIYIGDISGCRLNEIIIKDASGKRLPSIPKDEFKATVSFVDRSGSDETVIVVAKYDNKGVLSGMAFVYACEETDGVITLPFENADGEVAEIKAFCLEGIGSLTPMCQAVSVSK